MSVATAVASVLASQYGQAAILYWDGSGNATTGVGQGWDNAAYWSTTSGTLTPDPAAPPSLENGDTAVFSVPATNAATKIVNLNNDQSAVGLVFNAPGALATTATPVTGYFLMGGNADRTLSLGSGGITSSGGPVTIGSTVAGQRVNISLKASQTFNSSSSAQALFILNNISAGVTGSTALTLDGSNTGTKIDGNISDGSGVLALIKVNSTGKWLLNGSNTFSGGLTINAGAITFGGANAAGTGTLTFASGITIDASTSVTNAGNNAQVWNGAFTYGGGANYNIGTGAVNLGSGAGPARTVTVTANTFTVGGVISDGSGATTISKQGPGILALNGSNAFTGATIAVGGGTLAINTLGSLGPNNATLTFASGTALGITSVSTLSSYSQVSTGRTINFTGANAFGLDIANAAFDLNSTLGITSFTKSGVGTLTVSATQTYTGATAISAGRVIVAGINSTLATSGFSLGGGAILQTTGGAETTTKFVTLTAGSNGGGLDVSGTGPVTFNSTFTNTGAGPNRTFVLTGTGEGIFNGNLTNTTSGTTNSTALTVTKTGSGTWTLGGTNSYTGLTTVSAGTLNMNGSGTTGSVSVAAGATLSQGTTSVIGGTSTVVSSGTVTLAGANTNTGLTTVNAGSFNVTNSASVGTGSISFADTGGVVLNNTGAAAVTLTNTGGLLGSITFTGSKPLTLSGTFGFNGTTDKTVTLNGTSGNDLGLVGLTAPSNGNVAVIVNSANGARLNIGTLNLTGNSTVARILRIAGTGNVDVTGGVTNSSIASTFANGLTYAGSGTLTLSGTNSYTGATLVNLGTLALTTGSSGGTNVTVGAATVTAGVSGNAALNVRGNYAFGTASAGAITLVGGNGTSSGQGTLSLLDGTINAITLANTTAASTLTLGGATAGLTSAISLDLSNSSTDTITLGSAAGTGTQKLTLNAGGGVINLNQLPSTSLAAGTYNLIYFGTNSYTGAFNLGSTPAAAPGTVTTYKLSSLTTSSTALQLLVGVANTGVTAYWTGSQDTFWNTINGSNTNFTLNADGTGGNVIPDNTTDVFFTADTGVANAASNNTTLGQDFSIKSLRFLGTSGLAPTVAYTVGGANILTLGAGGLTVDAGVIGTGTAVNSGVTLGTDQTWTLSGTNSQNFTVGGVLNGNGKILTVSGDRRLTLTGGGTLGAVALGSTSPLTVANNANAMTVTGVISGGGGLGTVAQIIKGGTGVLTLSGTNTYAGITSVDAGAVTLTTGAALGVGGAGNETNVATGAQIRFQGGISVGETFAFTNSTDTVGLLNVSGNNEISSLVTVNGSSNFRIQSDLGTIILSGGLSNSGGQNVIQGAGNILLSGVLSGAAALNKGTAGAGTLSITGANTYTGSTKVNGGTVILGNGSTGGSIGTSSLLSLDAGSFIVNRSNSVSQSTSTQVNDLPIVISANGGTFTQGGSGTTTLSGSNTYVSATFVANGALVAGSNAPSGAAGAFGIATSAIVLGTAATTANNSNAALLTGGAFTIARPVTIANQATTGTYRIGGNTDNSSTFSGAITASQGFSVTQVATTGANQLNLTGGISANTAGLKTVNFANIGAVNVSGTGLSNGTGTVGLTQSGSGTTTLAVASSFTGATNVTSGVLRATVAGALGGTTGTLAVTNDGSLLLSGVGAINRINDAAALAVGSGTGTSTFGFEGGVSSSAETQTASLTLNSNSIIDFGALAGVSNTGNTLLFDSLVMGGGATNIKIYNWNGTVGQSTGNLPGSDSLNRLLFASDPSTQLGMVFGNISFYSDSGLTMIGVGQEVAFGGGGGANFELIAAIPEPSTVYSLLLVAGLAGFRERRRLRSVFARNK